MRHYYYISRTKLDMLLPQVRRRGFSLKISPKVDFAGVSVGADVESRTDSAVVTKLGKLLQALDKKQDIRDARWGDSLASGQYFRNSGPWRHGLFYFKGGIPEFWGRGEERLLKVSVAYLAWTTFRDSIVLLVGSPNNILGDKVAPEGVFMPGTSGVADAIRRLVNSFPTDEGTSPVIESGWGGEVSQPDIQVGSKNQYVEQYGRTRIPLPGFDDQWSSLAFAQFCLYHLQTLPQGNLETVFRIESTHESAGENFRDDLQQFSKQKLAETRRIMSDYPDHLAREAKEWKNAKRSATAAKLGIYSRVYVGSPLYTSLL